jgi:hypothetical protein
VHRRLRGSLEAAPLPVEVLIALDPQFLGDDGFHFGENPLRFGLEYPGAVFPIRALRVVGTADALGYRVAEEAVHGGVRKGAPIPCPVPLLVEDTGDGLLTTMLTEQFKEELPDGRLLRVNK